MVWTDTHAAGPSPAAPMGLAAARPPASRPALGLRERARARGPQEGFRAARRGLTRPLPRSERERGVGWGGWVGGGVGGCSQGRVRLDSPPTSCVGAGPRPSAGPCAGRLTGSSNLGCSRKPTVTRRYRRSYELGRRPAVTTASTARARQVGGLRLRLPAACPSAASSRRCRLPLSRRHSLGRRRLG